MQAWKLQERKFVDDCLGTTLSLLTLKKNNVHFYCVLIHTHSCHPSPTTQPPAMLPARPISKQVKEPQVRDRNSAPIIEHGSVVFDCSANFEILRALKKLGRFINKYIWQIIIAKDLACQCSKVSKCFFKRDYRQDYYFYLIAAWNIPHPLPPLSQ